MKRRTLGKTCFYAGIVCLLAGLQLRTVEAFVLRSETTAVLAKWTGPPQDSVHGALRSTLIDAVGPRKVVVPPDWLGWALLSAGGVLLVHGGIQLRKR